MRLERRRGRYNNPPPFPLPPVFYPQSDNFLNGLTTMSVCADWLLGGGGGGGGWGTGSSPDSVADLGSLRPPSTSSNTSATALRHSATKSSMAESTALARSRIPRLISPIVNLPTSSPTLFTLWINLATLFTRYSSSYTLPFFPLARFRSSRLRFFDVVRVALVPVVPVRFVYRVNRDPPPVVDASVGASEMLSGMSAPPVPASPSRNASGSSAFLRRSSLIRGT